jgi:hypothetical protein
MPRSCPSIAPPILPRPRNFWTVPEELGEVAASIGFVAMVFAIAVLAPIVCYICCCRSVDRIGPIQQYRAMRDYLERRTCSSHH